MPNVVLEGYRRGKRFIECKAGRQDTLWYSLLNNMYKAKMQSNRPRDGGRAVKAG